MGVGPDTLDAIVAANAYMTLATADAGGTPWATPVWFAHAGGTEFVWVSRPEARHSRNISARPAIGIAIFDSTVAPGTGQGVYIEARASEVSAADRAPALAIYAQGSLAAGLRPWTEADVSAPAQHRLYRALAERRFLLDGTDRRVEVP
jgi:nitroimidazol reductase NimA-like FMN-containing flavoprotein (pyridoxamine 5'-phosphate oxidase superfamily)